MSKKIESQAYWQGYDAGWEDAVNNAIEWIKCNNENGGCQFDNWEESFRKAMKE